MKRDTYIHNTRLKPIYVYKETHIFTMRDLNSCTNEKRPIYSQYETYRHKKSRKKS